MHTAHVIVFIIRYSITRLLLAVVINIAPRIWYAPIPTLDSILINCLDNSVIWKVVLEDSWTWDCDPSNLNTTWLFLTAAHVLRPFSAKHDVGRPIRRFRLSVCAVKLPLRSTWGSPVHTMLHHSIYAHFDESLDVWIKHHTSDQCEKLPRTCSLESIVG